MSWEILSPGLTPLPTGLRKRHLGFPGAFAADDDEFGVGTGTPRGFKRVNESSSAGGGFSAQYFCFVREPEL